MRTIASAAGALMLLASVTVASAQPQDEGYDDRARPGPDAESPYDGPPTDADRYPDGDETGPYQPEPDTQGPYDESPYDDGPPNDEGRPPSYDDRGAYDGPPDDEGYADDRAEPPPSRYADDEPRRHGHRQHGKRHRGSGRPDLGFRPYSDTGLGGSGYAGGYYGTYPEAY